MDTRGASARACCCRPDSSKAGVAPWRSPSADLERDVAHRAADVEGARAGTDDAVLGAYDGHFAHGRVRVDAHARRLVELHLHLAHLAANGAGPTVQPSVGLQASRRHREVDWTLESHDAAVTGLHIARQRALDALNSKVAGLHGG